MFISIALGLLYLKFKYVYFSGEYLLKIILGLCIIILVFLFSQKRTFKNKANVFIGKISYEIYLSHGVAMKIVHDLAPDVSSSIFIFSTIFITILISSLIHPISNFFVKKLRI